MNRADFIAAIVAAQDSAAATPRVAADQTPLLSRMCRGRESRGCLSAGQRRGQPQFGVVGDLPTPNCGTQTSNQGAAAMSEREVTFTLRADTSEFTKAMRRANRQMRRLRLWANFWLWTYAAMVTGFAAGFLTVALTK